MKKMIHLTEPEWEKVIDQTDKRFNIVDVIFDDFDIKDQADSLREIIQHKKVYIQSIKDCWVVSTKKLPMRILKAVFEFRNTELEDDGCYIKESVLKTLKI